MRTTAGAVLAALIMAAPAEGASAPEARWLPNAPDATWTYGWYDTGYSNKLTLERYTVDRRTDTTVRLRWTTADAGNPPERPLAQGSIDYSYAATGIFNSNWASTPPDPAFPVLCPQVAECGNSLAGAHYQLIWGARSPVLQEPLYERAAWTSLGGQANDVASVNRYLGTERVVVPAFPVGVQAARIESDITQAGAIGDPYGSGVRTTWWVYGVGPVKVVFRHAGGEQSVTELHATNLRPRIAPTDKARLPLKPGEVMRFRYTNSKHLARASVQEFTVADVENATARVDVRDVSGPIRVRGSYLFTTSTAGIVNTQALTRAADTVRFPPLGPRGRPAAQRRRFFTPFDLMTFGFNPVVPAHPVRKQTWRPAKGGRDRSVFGVTGVAKVVGHQKIRVPAGRYTALLVESRLTQRGFPYGSGVRRSWFAPGVGLVKLEFRHRDGSVSRVVRLPRG